MAARIVHVGTEMIWWWQGMLSKEWVRTREGQLPKSRGEERSETGLAATALEGKLVKGE